MVNTKSLPAQAGSKSRIGRKPVLVPDGVSVNLSDSMVTVRGPKGELSMKVPQGISIEIQDCEVSVLAKRGKPREHGRTRAQLANLVEGITQGWVKTLEIVGTGFRASTDGKILTLNLGFSHPVVVEAPKGITFSVTQNKVTVAGVDKQLVGQVAGNIRQFRVPEPYKGKGIKYEGEFIRKKAGKAAKGTTAA